MLDILVPTDYSDCSCEALRYASALAADGHGRLLLLHVEEPMSPYIANDAAEVERRSKYRAIMQEQVASKLDVAYEERHAIGAPIDVIVNAAETMPADLIVMGTRGRTGVTRLVLGSVAEAVSRRAPCPVLTLKPGTNRNRSVAPLIETAAEWPAVEFQGDLGRTSVEAGDDNPATSLILRALRSRASDIHLDPVGDELLIRFRIDGRMRAYCHMDHKLGNSLLTQFKLMADLDIADPFHAKEGRLRLPSELQGIEVRLTCVPVSGGEAASLRLLSRSQIARPLQELGLSESGLSMTERMLKHGEGLVLVTGPTGSGKTTTLYSMLRALDDGSRAIVSIEDPIELPIPSFRQLAVDQRHGLTMTTGLRTLLRLDPDIVLISEIRDVEAADVALRAASSGKYVFTSLHTRDVASTVTALRDLHIDNRSLAANLSGIISQRLLRRPCGECSRMAAPSAAEAALFEAHGIEVPREVTQPVGCARCSGTGYYGRIGVFEVVVPEEGVKRMIEVGCAEEELRHALRGGGARSLEMDALGKIAQGLTTPPEFLAMTAVRLRD